MASSVPLPISKLVGVKCRQYVFFKAFYDNGSQGHRTRFLNYWYVKDEECLNPLTAGKQDTKLGEALWKQCVNAICTSWFFSTCMFESWLNPVWDNNSLCQRVFMYVHVGGDRIRASGGPKDWCRVQEAVRLGPAGHAAALPVERSRHGSGEDAQAVRRYSCDRVDDFIFLIVNMWPLINHTITTLFLTVLLETGSPDWQILQQRVSRQRWGVRESHQIQLHQRGEICPCGGQLCLHQTLVCCSVYW